MNPQFLAVYIACCEARRLITIKAHSFHFYLFLLSFPVITTRRRIANSVPDLSVQLDVFDEQRECDESQSLQGPDGINLNSHLDVFYAILRQVSIEDDLSFSVFFLHHWNNNS